MLEQHPLSAAFPAMSEDDFCALRDSIKSIGVQNPITIFDGMVIDGWHRYRAATDLGMDCPYVELPSDVDPRDFVLAQNKARRNCTASQLATATVEVHRWKPHGDASRFQSATGAHPEDCGDSAAESPPLRTGAQWEEPAVSAAEMAKQAGVSVRTIVQAKKVARDASPEVKDAVKRGEVSVKAAASVSDLPAPEQIKALQTPAPKKAKVPDVEVEKLQETINALHEQVSTLTEQRDVLAEELEAALRILRADEQLAQAMAQITQAQALARSYKSRMDGLMREKNEAIRLKQSADRKIKSLEAGHVTH